MANSGCNKTNQKTSGVKTCIVHRCRYCTTRWTGPSRLCAPIRRRTVETDAATASLVRSHRWWFHYLYINILSSDRSLRSLHIIMQMSDVCGAIKVFFFRLQFYYLLILLPSSFSFVFYVYPYYAVHYIRNVGTYSLLFVFENNYELGKPTLDT